MIQQQTKLRVSDNSGAKTVKCIKILGHPKKRFAHIGDILIVSVLELRDKHKQNSKVKKGSIHKSILLRTKKKKIRKDGSLFSFNENSVCLLNNNNQPISTRLLGPVPKELRNKKHMRLVNISSGIL